MIQNWGADVKDRNELAVKFNENLKYSRTNCIGGADPPPP